MPFLPSVSLVQVLPKLTVTVVTAVPELPTGVDICGDAYAACDGSSCLVVLTEWDEFRWLDFARVLAAMSEPNIVDARNLLDPAAVRRMGFQYTGIGRQ